MARIVQGGLVHHDSERYVLQANDIEAHVFAVLMLLRHHLTQPPPATSNNDDDDDDKELSGEACHQSSCRRRSSSSRSTSGSRTARWVGMLEEDEARWPALSPGPGEAFPLPPPLGGAPLDECGAELRAGSVSRFLRRPWRASLDMKGWCEERSASSMCWTRFPVSLRLELAFWKSVYGYIYMDM